MTQYKRIGIDQQDRPVLRIKPYKIAALRDAHPFLLQRAPVLEVGGDPGRPKAVDPELGGDPAAGTSCQRPALAAAEVRNMPLSRPPRGSPGRYRRVFLLFYYFATFWQAATDQVVGPFGRFQAVLETQHGGSCHWMHCTVCLLSSVVHRRCA